MSDPGPVQERIIFYMEKKVTLVLQSENKLRHGVIRSKFERQLLTLLPALQTVGRGRGTK